MHGILIVSFDNCASWWEVSVLFFFLLMCREQALLNNLQTTFESG